ncbi:Gfo/Idh/MocA family oxidoreductase [Azospirillum sp.]|uniref:Gfo/Idh/MocA family protein n=1 Tax=Azospirillum sp. TaxID=34012 RepID=UPI002D33B744|nr:Gfo/Idh/MocA family oxidoreductase [Azospirillum sp.]HYD63838.1 Gfo/Idh/MocA family oxidoreductase [Azospirillum sp.]
MSNPVRIGVLGCGRVAQRYLEVFRDELAGEAQVVACADLVPEKAERFAAALGARVVNGLDGLAAAEPDLVCVLTESGNHAKHVLALIERGVNVVVEKPVALRPEDALAMRDAAATRGLICAVVKQNRYNPAMRFVRGAVEEGRFGRIVLAGVRVHWCRTQAYYDDPWHGRWSMDGGVLAQQAIHHLDALQWVAGPVEAVCAAGQAVLNSLEAEDTAVAAVRFASGAMGTIEATTSARPRDFEASLHLVGEKALAKIGGIALNRIETWEPVDAHPGDADVPALHSQEVPTGYGLGHGPYLRGVLETLRQGRTDVPVGVDEGMKSLRLLHALYTSMERGGWVSLADAPVSARLGL